MIINPNKKDIKPISLINHSVTPIRYTSAIVRLRVFLYTSARTIILKCPIFTRSTIINYLNQLVKYQMSERNTIIKTLDTPALIEDSCALLDKTHS